MTALDVLCWCEADVVGVPASEFHAGRTLSCGRSTCQPATGPTLVVAAPRSGVCTCGATFDQPRAQGRPRRHCSKVCRDRAAHERRAPRGKVR